ncbi:MAG: ATP-binding protein, partial [Alphaproteobacteria bacterium]
AQALTNILKNAAEAVQARMHDQPEPPGAITAAIRREGDLVLFEVEDNGVGLPEEGRDRLVEPYVTTREKGTGLGLAIVGRILEDHGGSLILGDARQGRGAQLVMTLPQDDLHKTTGVQHARPIEQV